MRHATATHALDHGAKIEEVAELLTHDEIRSTQKYDRKRKGRSKAAAAALPQWLSNMAEFIVSIDIQTKEMAAAGVSRLLGIPHSSSSHNKGDKRGFHDDTWECTIWRVESGLEGTRPLEEHVEHLLTAVVPVIIRQRHSLPRDFTADLNVGAICDTANCGVTLRPAFLKRLAEANIGLEITAYPASR